MKKTAEKLIYYGFIIFAATVGFTMSGQSAGALLILLGWMLGIIYYRKFLWKTGYLNFSQRTLITFCAVFFVSSLLSINVYKSLDRTLKALGEFGLFFAVASFDWENGKKEHFIKILSIFAVLEACYAILQYFTGATFLNYADTKQIIIRMYEYPLAFKRAYGTWDHPNSLGGILGMIIPITFFIGLSLKDAKGKIFYMAVSLILTFCLAVTFTRGAWIGLSAALTVIGLIKSKKFIIFPIILAILIMAVPATRHRIIKSFNPNTEPERKLIWKTAVETILKKPFFGTGPETFSEVFYKSLPEDMKTGEDIKRRIFFHYHNTYLGLWAEAGLIALGLFLVFSGSVLIYGIKNLKNITDPFSAGLCAGCMGTVIDFLVHGLVDYNLRGNTIYFFYIACGMIVYLAANKYSSEQSTASN
ncbi:MAG: hypothetical protein A2252_00635 [Elusimicrobia bacterium RIFOXYA2_FULL_39_19]|nr:MAG: hypothetical protein A2252_00635 [Elusimicrobia bacterium RIFOXYA2_FULL_39_19]